MKKLLLLSSILFTITQVSCQDKISDDGLNWKDLKTDDGSYHFFEMGRDMMMFNDTQESGKWIAYF